MRVVVWAPLGALLLGGVVVFAALQRRGGLPAGFRGGAELGTLVGAHLLPGLAVHWLGRGVRHALVWTGLAWLAALTVPVGLLWLVEWIRRRWVVPAG